MKSIYIGFDRREASGFAVARHTARQHLALPVPVYGVVLEHLIAIGLYKRPTKVTVNSEGRRQLIDTLSIRGDYDGRISTEHALARFFVPHLAREGWALFMDGDVLIRRNLLRIFDGLSPATAVYCVKHDHEPAERSKMAGQLQTKYARKNWSSVMVWNVEHPANKRLTLEAINSLPGRDLHRLCWLKDNEIGGLDPRWNWLADVSDPAIDPAIVHFTNGLPDMP